MAGTVISPTVLAADHAADEAAIRALIAQQDAGKQPPRMNKFVFWSGAYQRPVMDGEQPTPRKPEPGRPGAIEERVPNSQKIRTIVRRIVVSEAGDMAYEYSDATLSVVLKSGGQATIPTSTLRVWQKDAGQWKVAAFFNPGLQD